MINSVSSNVGVNYTQAGSTRHVVSTEQKSAIESVLAKYDASSLSQSDAQEISDSFKDMGIRPSRDLRETIETSGFDADEIRNLSSNHGVHGMPPPLPGKNDSEEISLFEELLSGILDSDTNNGEKTASEAVEDYTSKYSNLTTEAKDEVKDIMSQFKDGSANSKVNTNNLVMDSLKDILSKYDNYKHIEVYV
ncbi:MAG: hypothetical protein KAQ94_00880 [Arcobacteraceae bacterium]|nr:hypothetical protein [Arcobacteraceae bacterium]